MAARWYAIEAGITDLTISQLDKIEVLGVDAAELVVKPKAEKGMNAQEQAMFRQLEQACGYDIERHYPSF